jgi:hypothetical protein
MKTSVLWFGMLIIVEEKFYKKLRENYENNTLMSHKDMWSLQEADLQEKDKKYSSTLDLFEGQRKDENVTSREWPLLPKRSVW